MTHLLIKRKRAYALVVTGSALLAIGFARASAAPEGARAVPARVLQSDATVARFVVDVPAPVFTPSSSGFEKISITGFNATGKSGEPPALSRRYLVALPPTGAFSVSTRIVATQAYGTHRLEPIATPILIQGIDELQPNLGERIDWDPAKYQGWSPPNVVEHDQPVYIRHQRALPIGVNPVFYDASSNEVVVATQIEVEVRFAGGTARAERSVAADVDTRWSDTFARMFVNARQAKEWQVPKPDLSPTAIGAARAAPGAVKLRIRETGIHKVLASTLVAAGFPVGQSVDNLRLYRRTYSETTLTAAAVEIPIYVRESAGGIAGIFDGSDLAIFYGLRLRDDPSQADAREQYSSVNTYWLEPGDGVDMATRTPAPGTVSADTANAFYQMNEHFEIDTFFRENTPPQANDYYYVASGRITGPMDLPFTLNTVRPGGTLALSAELHGWDYTLQSRTVRLSLVNSKGEFLLNADYPVNNKQRVTFTAPAISDANLSVGANTFRMALPAGATRPRVDAMINFVTVSYPSLYRARGNVLRFNTASLSGDATVTVTGLSSNTDFELFDITIPNAPSHLVTGAANFTPAGGGYAFSFRENIPAQRTFVLTPVSRMVDIAAADVILDAPSAIVGDPAENGVDVLVVAHASYLPQMQTWVSYRRAQGSRVLMVDVADVFDEFNGGVEHARAVQRFTRHFFERGNASALVLVGDASEDQKRVHADSGPNFVPTFSFSDDVEGNLIDEVITSDKRFVKMPGPGGVIDSYPDMIVGRLPVGTTTELDIVLAKTLDYESPDASEFWRKRMIIVADDEYSQGLAQFGGTQLCYGYEEGFRFGQETVASIIENSLPAGYDVIRFWLRDYTDDFYPCASPQICDPSDCASAVAAMAFTRQTATEVLMDELNQGATLVAIQSHMNRSTVTHERLLSTETTLPGSGPSRDHLRMANRNRPWIMFGLGCHFSDYTVFRELSDIWSPTNPPNGDAFAEQLLLQNSGRGAVGTYGSSGFEFLSANNRYMNVVAQVWFYEAPYDTMINQTQAEWKFGELMFLAETQLAGFGDQIEPVERYHILGDPLLRIDAGPPSFAVNVNGRPIDTGEVVTSGGEGDTIRVVATVTDENAIHKFELEVAGQDLTDSLRVQALTDPQLPHARQYRLSFTHKLRPENYDIVLRAFQAPDTTVGNYHMAAEFTLRVESSIEVSVNGRVITSGGMVPTTGNYRVDLSFPVFVEGSEIAVLMDDTPVVPFTLTNPSPEDSLSWIITFKKTLSPGQHTLRITAGPGIEFSYQLVVSDEAGLADVLNYPNPMGQDGTNFMYSIESEITAGSIDIYTSSGKRVRSLEIPVSGRLPGSNAVFWDGRDGAGDKLANGTYLYVIKVTQRGGSATVRGKLAMVQ